MSNYLRMEKKQAVIGLLRLGWTYRRIQRQTGVRRETISRYDRELDSKAANVPPGSGEGEAGSEDQKRPKRPPGNPSRCGGYRELIEQKLQTGLTGKRIHQDLVFEHGFSVSYDSVKRFCRRLKKRSPEVFARIEVPPGSQMQVDFCQGAPTRYPGSDRFRRPHLFQAILSFSRHCYQEVVWRQDLPTFIRCFENAFRYFGGVSSVVVIDNLKSGITDACFYDPEVNRIFAALATHYGFTVVPIRPRTPRHNGKIERNHQYTESSAIRGRRFESLEDQNRHLEWWNSNIARLRIHGTTKQQVWERFVTLEQSALQSLPQDRFRFFQTGTRTVSSDGHIELAGAFYSVPDRYLGIRVRVDWDNQLIKIYHLDQQIALHTRTGPGRFQTTPEHLPEYKRPQQDQIEARLLAKALAIGPAALAWATEALQIRGLLGHRLLQGMISLTRRHPAHSVNQACQTALGHHAFRYRTLVALCKRQPSEQAPLFSSQHELIRPMTDYQELIQEGDPIE